MEDLWARLYGMSFVDLLVCSRVRPRCHGQGVVIYGAVESSTDSSAETAEIAAELLRVLRLLRVLLRVLHRLLLRLLDC